MVSFALGPKAALVLKRRLSCVLDFLVDAFQYA